METPFEIGKLYRFNHTCTVFFDWPVGDNDSDAIIFRHNKCKQEKFVTYLGEMLFLVEDKKVEINSIKTKNMCQNWCHQYQYVEDDNALEYSINTTKEDLLIFARQAFEPC
jgi:hypothetical protein